MIVTVVDAIFFFTSDDASKHPRNVGAERHDTRSKWVNQAHATARKEERFVHRCGLDL